MLRFRDSIILFKFNGIDLIGNPLRKHLIGLNSEGKELVDFIFKGNNSDEYIDIINRNKDLLKEMEANGYFEYFESNNKTKIIESAYFHVRGRLTC